MSQELIQKFLNLPPTTEELERVLFSDELIYAVNSQNKHRLKGYLPDPYKLGWMKHDLDKYIELLKQDALKQKEMMQQIIDAMTKIPLEREQVSR